MDYNFKTNTDVTSEENATHKILKYKDGANVKVPITKITSTESSIVVTVKKDNDGTDTDIVNLDFNAAELDVSGSPREIAIDRSVEDQIGIRLDENIKLRDNLVTFGDAPVGQDISALEDGALFMHTVDVA